MQDVLSQCDAMIRLGSKSFSSAARLFDPSTRDVVILLYAWCRYCDDQIDGQSLGHQAPGFPQAKPSDAPGPAVQGPFDPAAPGQHGSAQQRLEELVAATQSAFQDEAPQHPVFIAFQQVMQRFHIPRRIPLELLKGFEMDVQGVRYRSFEDLLLYCYRVAGTVGLMMARVIGARDEAADKHAIDLGIAMQLTNIARDVIEDARVGRVYLPLDWLREAGIPADSLEDPRHRVPLAALVRRLLQQASAYYDSGDQGLRYLPFRSALAVAAAREVYSAIGTRVLAQGTNAWDHRVCVSKAGKLLLTGKGLLRVLVQPLRAVTPYRLSSRIFLQPDEPGDGA